MGDNIGIGWKETALICGVVCLFTWSLFFAWTTKERNDLLAAQKARMELAIERLEADGYRMPLPPNQ